MSIPSDECPKCKNVGWIYYTDENGYECGKRCDCGILERERMKALLKFADIPLKYKDVRLNQLSSKVYRTEEGKSKFITACKKIKEWLDKFDENYENGFGLYIFSQTKGSGKTMIASGIANELIENKHKIVKFATSLQILQEIRRTWDRTNNESESELIADLGSSDILIIDDFGTETTKDWVQEKFYSIINDRYLNGKITIFTSNYDLDNIEYDERITNRIKEVCYLIPFANESVREYIAEQRDKA